MIEFDDWFVVGGGEGEKKREGKRKEEKRREGKRKEKGRKERKWIFFYGLVCDNFVNIFLFLDKKIYLEKLRKLFKVIE